MKNLQLERCWCVFEGTFLSAIDGTVISSTSANSDSLTTFEEASRYFLWRGSRQYPPAVSVALSLDAAGVIAVSLLNCYDGDRGLCEGASMVASALDSYTELCHRGEDGVSVRILCRGSVPKGVVPPPRVQFQTTGFVTLTGQRISPHPPWRGDNGGVITVATEALASLFVPQRPRYIHY